jgi:hypothetical protein
MHQQQLAAEQQARFEKQQARFIHVDKDGNAIILAQNTSQGLGASSRDTNYRENVWHLIGGGCEKAQVQSANIPKWSCFTNVILASAMSMSSA